ncbi:MAG: N-acetylmuramoyl-L-alanine amidase [Desulfovibrionaceae bacterium]
MAQPSNTSGKTSLFWRVLPALGFMLALCVLVVAVYDTGYSALPPAEKRYTAAKEGVQALKSDEKRSAYRDQWLKLADEFFSIYQLDPQWPNRPAALYLAAETMEELASRSFAARDYKLAVDRYEQVALKHATSRLADDALLRAAIIRAEYMKDIKAALQLLKRVRTQYPRGDMAPKALELEKALLEHGTVPKDVLPSAGIADTGNKTAPAAPAVQAEDKSSKSAAGTDKNLTGNAALTQVSWTSLDKDRVRIVVELDRNAGWQARMQEGNQAKGIPARIVLDMTNTVPQTQVQPGARVKDSLLTRVRVDHSKVGKPKADSTRLCFDFSAARRYDAQVEHDPFRIILTVAAGRASLPKGVGSRVGFAEVEQPTPPACPPVAERKRRVLHVVREDSAGQSGKADTRAGERSAASHAMTGGSMAEQLGLSVQSVFIDAGHGGKDPGTIHNGIVERDIVLDISRRLGRLLEANGFDVEYSRTKDIAVPLSTRTRLANTKKADLFVSIHVNANADMSAMGFETYYLDLASNTQAARVATLENAASDRKLGDMQSVLADIMLNARTQESRRLASDIRRVTLSRVERRGFNVKDGGAKAAPFHVLIGAGMPAVLVEVGYCTNSQDARKLANASFRHALAEGLAEGIMAYRDRLKQRNSAETVLTPKSESAMRLFRDF